MPWRRAQPRTGRARPRRPTQRQLEGGANPPRRSPPRRPRQRPRRSQGRTSSQYSELEKWTYLI